jgi:hypothetical protein
LGDSDFDAIKIAWANPRANRLRPCGQHGN